MYTPTHHPQLTMLWTQNKYAATPKNFGILVKLNSAYTTSSLSTAAKWPCLIPYQYTVYNDHMIYQPHLLGSCRNNSWLLAILWTSLRHGQIIIKKITHNSLVFNCILLPAISRPQWIMCHINITAMYFVL